MLEALESYNVIELDPEVCYSDIFDILTPGDIVLWRGKANHAFIYLKKGSKPGTAHILELTREDDFSKEGFEIVDLYLYRPETRVYILRNK
jgi:cell wall-associated NlpC family hydrolase